MSFPEKPIRSNTRPAARLEALRAWTLARCIALFTALPGSRHEPEKVKMPENISVWIVVVGVLTALWIFIFKFIAPFVDRMTMREVRLSKIERDIENLTAKIDLIYEVVLDRHREQE